MSTNVIDINVHGSAFPATYTGPGTILGNPLVSASGISGIAGYFTGNGNATNIPIGTLPIHVAIFDATNNISWDWYRGLPATDTVKGVAAGTRTIDTGSAIVVTVDYAGNATVSLSAALAASGALLIYEIEC